MHAPPDKFNLVYFTFCSMGLAILMPWSSFTNATDYWMYKYRTVNGTNSSEPSPHDKLNELQLQWNSLLTIVNLTPKLIILLLTAVWGEKLPIFATVITCVSINIMVFSICDVLTFIDTDNFQQGFLYLTLVSVAVISICTAVMQGRFTAMVALFPENYMEGFLACQQVGAIGVSILNILVLASGANSVGLASWTFMSGVFIVALSLVLFVISSYSSFFKHHTQVNFLHGCDNNTSISKLSEETPLIESNNNNVDMNTFEVAKTIWPWIVTMILEFTVTLSLFPSIAALVESVGRGKGHPWNDIYFTPVVCFLNYNVMSFLGILLPRIYVPKVHPDQLPFVILAGSALRIIFIPLMLFSNAVPNNRIVSQVYIKSDTAFIVMMIIFGLTSGYFFMCCMIFGPKLKLMHPKHQSKAAAILMFSLIIGLASGAYLSQPLLKLL